MVTGKRKITIRRYDKHFKGDSSRTIFTRNNRITTDKEEGVLRQYIEATSEIC